MYVLWWNGIVFTAELTFVYWSLQHETKLWYKGYPHQQTLLKGGVMQYIYIYIMFQQKHTQSVYKENVMKWECLK